MSELSWSWLCAPYAVCAVGMVAVALVGAVVRGDRVMRLGMIGAAATALPWAVCSAVAACTQDPELATRLLRLGNGPVAFVGPNLMLVLLGVSGQLERNRWVARTSYVVGLVLLAICWGTTWTVPGVHLVLAGHLLRERGTADRHSPDRSSACGSAVGLVIARRAAPTGERRSIVADPDRRARARRDRSDRSAARLRRVGLLSDRVAAGARRVRARAVPRRLRTDLLRPQGFDRSDRSRARRLCARARRGCGDRVRERWRVAAAAGDDRSGRVDHRDGGRVERRAATRATGSR